MSPHLILFPEIMKMVHRAAAVSDPISRPGPNGFGDINFGFSGGLFDVKSFGQMSGDGR